MSASVWFKDGMGQITVYTVTESFFFLFLKIDSSNKLFVQKSIYRLLEMASKLFVHFGENAKK